MSATRELVEFVVNTDLEEIPLDAILMAKRCLLDCVGVTLAGSLDPLRLMLQAYLDKVGGITEATIFGTNKKTTRSNAALVNGALAHVLDFDDTSYSTGGHPTAPVMAALFSVGEAGKISGEKILEAFILGFEAQCKLGAAMNPSFFDMGWHPMGPLGRVGSVIGVGKLLGFDEEKMENALGLACVTASGIFCVGTHAKAMNSGLAAEGGVRSAQFTDYGLTGPRGILEKEGGFCNMFSRSYDLSKITRNLGRPYDLINPGVAFKQYPSCTATHAAIDAILEIRNENDVSLDEVSSIECRVGPWIPKLLVHPIPNTGLQSKFSMPYCLSLAFIHGVVKLEDFHDEALSDKSVMELVRKVTVVPDEELGREGYVEGAIVTVKDTSGKRFERRVNRAKGNPENPLSDNELYQKFFMCATNCLKPVTADKLSYHIQNLEKVSNIGELIRYTHE